jgi:hypothetical protein
MKAAQPDGETQVGIQMGQRSVKKVEPSARRANQGLWDSVQCSGRCDWFYHPSAPDSIIHEEC